MLVGIIADTHGLIRPQVFRAFAGVELILHAGDVGGRSVLDELRAIAPVRAVFGNTDAPGDPDLDSGLELTLAGLSVHVSHGHEIGSPTPDRLLARYSADVVIFGHTHKALIEHHGRRLALNPGAAGPRRFNLEPSVARLRVADGHADVDIIWL